VPEKPTGSDAKQRQSLSQRHSATGTLSAISDYANTAPGTTKSLKEIDMNKLTIKDLATTRELDRDQMKRTQGGMGRTPQQILAWELTGKPATWQGLVLEEDNRLHVPSI
jgi:hypothetical protein